MRGLHGLSWTWKHLPMLSMPMPSNAGCAPGLRLLRTSRSVLPLLQSLLCQLRQQCQLLPPPRRLGYYPTPVKLLLFQKFDEVLEYPHMNSRACLSSVIFAKITLLAVSFAATSLSAVVINHSASDVAYM